MKKRGLSRFNRTLETAQKYRFFQMKHIFDFFFFNKNLIWWLKENKYSSFFVTKLFAGVLPAEPLSDPNFSNWASQKLNTEDVFRDKLNIP